ncbi:MAG: hypothetical protein ABI659_02630, partial [Nitrosospira sp.]
NKYSDQIRMCDYTHNPVEAGIEGSDVQLFLNARTRTSQTKGKGEGSLVELLSNHPKSGALH